ncbi:MAG: carboxypeptidase-like regulatory domain-containing protein [Desulfobacterales bacterium]|nr:carboxypeptidase-like regulatory domain-containing protein [Desulfobacterales bacterium]
MQNRISCKVTVICDTDYSGSFLSLLTPPQDKERIIISSTSNDHKALFLAQGTISFSNFFWKNVMNGMNVRDSFLKAGNTIGLFSETPSYNKPLMDDNGNGIGNERSDGNLAMYRTIGTGIRFAENDPLVGSVSTDQRLKGGVTSADIQADVTTISGNIVKVWAVITPPDHSSNQDLSEIDLTDAGDGSYKGTYSKFSSFGTYQVDIFYDMNGNTYFFENISIFQPAFPDSYEDDDNPDQAKVIIINDETPQHHNLYDPGDEDWIKFYGLSGESYEIIIKNTGTNFSADIEIYNSDIEIQTLAESWKCPRTEFSASPEVSGEGTEYDIMINHPTGPLPGWVIGKLTEEGSGKPIEGALIRVGTSATDISHSEGTYTINHKPGTFTMQICGHEFEDVIISEGGTTVNNLTLTEDVTENCLTENSSPKSLPPLHTDDIKQCFINTAAD